MRHTKMTECRVCGEPVAKDAQTCPHCGTNAPTKASYAVQIITLCILFACFILFGLFFRLWNT